MELMKDKVVKLTTPKNINGNWGIKCMMVCLLMVKGINILELKKIEIAEIL